MFCPYDEQAPYVPFSFLLAVLESSNSSIRVEYFDKYLSWHQIMTLPILNGPMLKCLKNNSRQSHENWDSVLKSWRYFNGDPNLKRHVIPVLQVLADCRYTTAVEWNNIGLFKSQKLAKLQWPEVL